MSKRSAELICAALLAIVAVLRKENDLPDYRGVTVELKYSNTETLGGVEYVVPIETRSAL